ncbi:hypothetical protein PHYSODRAFT_321473 [Phytophthora sojae]|uniref:Uncharacterized protein n=1 Tax=Phytophthora sojae (strain P6497) TaxID=1094619 RepID=G4YH25_PHYSP|nr:hypothetical protein PHYSODRAFT_321473 [Phytophthora sojae]EGZ27726.1 hypothetical protein PHYSODRAFT_321473 [Phytophthora sojae]|eukprot:XP_009515001.1 hypothetical protein PHYSODRAFT_321473 [Phytophthora sojae]
MWCGSQLQLRDVAIRDGACDEETITHDRALYYFVLLATELQHSILRRIVFTRAFARLHYRQFPDRWAADGGGDGGGGNGGFSASGEITEMELEAVLGMEVHAVAEAVGGAADEKPPLSQTSEGTLAVVHSVTPTAEVNNGMVEVDVVAEAAILTVAASEAVRQNLGTATMCLNGLPMRGIWINWGVWICEALNEVIMRTKTTTKAQRGNNEDEDDDEGSAISEEEQEEAEEEKEKNMEPESDGNVDRSGHGEDHDTNETESEAGEAFVIQDPTVVTIFNISFKN